MMQEQEHVRPYDENNITPIYNEPIHTVTISTAPGSAKVYDTLGDVDAKDAKRNFTVSIVAAIILTLLAVPCFACLPFISLYKFNDSNSDEARLYSRRAKILFILFFFIGFVYIVCILLPLFAFLLAYASGAVY